MYIVRLSGNLSVDIHPVGLTKQKETAIDIYWTWDGWYLDTSGKAIQYSYTTIV
jgi:hypothetical protein